jgi:hypothetical protein
MPLTSFVVLFALAAPAAAPREAAAERGARESCQVGVTSIPAGGRQARLPSFSATKVLDLEFRTDVTRRDAATLYLRIYTPRGHLYQTFTLMLAPAVPGEPRPPAIARLPVAGTAITVNGLYGRWRAEPWLGGDAVTCGAAREFFITE